LSDFEIILILSSFIRIKVDVNIAIIVKPLKQRSKVFDKAMPITNNLSQLWLVYSLLKDVYLLNSAFKIHHKSTDSLDINIV